MSWYLSLKKGQVDLRSVVCLNCQRMKRGRRGACWSDNAQDPAGFTTPGFSAQFAHCRVCLCQSRRGIWSAEALLRPAAPPASVSVAAADLSPCLRLMNCSPPAESCVWRHVLPGEQHASAGSTEYYSPQTKEYEREG